MKIAIAGCGKVGAALIEQLTKENHDVTIIDRDESRMAYVTDSQDVMTYVGHEELFFEGRGASGETSIGRKDEARSAEDLMPIATRSGCRDEPCATRTRIPGKTVLGKRRTQRRGCVIHGIPVSHKEENHICLAEILRRGDEIEIFITESKGDALPEDLNGRYALRGIARAPTARRVARQGREPQRGCRAVVHEHHLSHGHPIGINHDGDQAGTRKLAGEIDEGHAEVGQIRLL